VGTNKTTGSGKVVPPPPHQPPQKTKDLLFGGEGCKKEAPSLSERILHIDVRLHGLLDGIF